MIIFAVFGLILSVFMATQNDLILPGKVRMKVYRYYIHQLEGDYTDEKHAWLLSERDRYQDVLQNKDTYEEQYYRGEIEPSVYRQFLDETKEADARLGTLEYLIEKSIYLGQLQEDSDKVSYFYDLDINDYIENMGVNIIVILLIMVLTVHIFGEDESCGTCSMVKSSKDGRQKVFRARIWCTLLLSAIIGVVFSVAEWITKSQTYQLGDGSQDIRCLASMRESNLAMSIREYLILCIGTRIVSAIFFAIIVMGITLLVKNVISDYVIALAVAYLPYLLKEIIKKTIGRISLFRGFAVYEGYKKPLYLLGFHGMFIWLLCYMFITAGIVVLLYKKEK